MILFSILCFCFVPIGHRNLQFRPKIIAVVARTPPDAKRCLFFFLGKHFDFTCNGSKDISKMVHL